MAIAVTGCLPCRITPPVAILIPAYNEEKVIERTVRAALMSHYPHFRVIVIDDGSSDKTYDVAKAAFQHEITSGKVLVLTKPNSGKAEALNYALQFVTEEIFVGIDADTVIAREAVTRLVPHFLDARIGAVAGNAKVEKVRYEPGYGFAGDNRIRIDANKDFFGHELQSVVERFGLAGVRLGKDQHLATCNLVLEGVNAPAPSGGLRSSDGRSHSASVAAASYVLWKRSRIGCSGDVARRASA